MPKRRKDKLLSKKFNNALIITILAPIVVVVATFLYYHKSIADKTIDQLRATAWNYYQEQAPAIGIKAVKADIKGSCSRHDSPAEGIRIGPTVCSVGVQKTLGVTSAEEAKKLTEQLAVVTKKEGFHNFLAPTSLVADLKQCQVGADYPESGNYGPDNTWTYDLTCGKTIKEAPDKQPN